MSNYRKLIRILLCLKNYKNQVQNYRGIIVTVSKSMSIIFVMSATVVSYAMDRHADQARQARVKSSFQRAAQELKEEELRMFDGKIPVRPESGLEKDIRLYKTRKKSKHTW
jgi:hypothetical protein